MKLKLLLLMLMCVTFVTAVDWTPQGNINLQDYYNITGAPYINATLYYGNVSQMTGVIGLSNSSEYWDDMNTINATQMQDSSGELNIKESWLTTFWNTIFSARTTDNLTEGSTNKYDNSSWNEDSHLNITEHLGSLNCSDTEIPKYNSTSLRWECEEDYGQPYTNGTGLSLVGDIFSITLLYFTDKFIELTDTFGGDVSGTYDDIQLAENSVGDNELNESNISNANIINDAGYITDDTNASTACSDGEYLDGSGNCIDLNATIDDRENDTTYTAEEDLIYLDGTEFKSNKTVLNESIEVYGYYNSEDFNISDYYNSTETDTEIENANTSMKDYVDSNPHSFINTTSASDLNNLIEIAGENITSGTIAFARLPTLTNLLTLDWANITNKIASDFNYLILSKWENITGRPTLLSNFSNDVGYVTNSTMNKTVGYLDIIGEPTNLSEFTDDLGKGNWSDDKDDYSTTSEASALYYNKTSNIDAIGYDIIADNINGTFNWTTTDEWSSFDGTTFDFNESNLATTYFLANATNVVTGTGSGTLENIQTYDGVTYNVTEVASDFELRVNFTGIIEFTTLIVRHKIDENNGHQAVIQMWDYVNSRWEGYGYLSEETTSRMQTFGVYDDDNHIEDGVVQVRFYQDESPTPPQTHIHQFDWVSISKGYGTPVGEEIDPLSFHTNENINASGYNVTASNFFGNLNWSWLENVPTYALITDLVEYVGNWSADKPDYSTTAEAGALYATIDEPIWTANYTAHNTSWSQDTTYTNGSAISLVGTQFNLTTCGDNEIWKMDGAVWNCETDAEGTGLITDQNDELNTTGGPTFQNVTVQAIYGNGDSDTYINWSGTEDQLELFAGDLSMIHLVETAGGDTLVLNQDSNDIDFRVESDNLLYAFVLDGATGKIRMQNLSSCDTIDTDSDGYLSCGTDDDTLGSLSCADGKIAKWNSTSSLWYCADDEVGEPGAGDIEGVLTPGDILYGGCTTGTCSLYANGTFLNDTTLSVADVYNDTTWVLSLNYITNAVSDLTNYYTKTIIDSLGNFSAWDKDYNDLINTPTYTNDTWVDTYFVRLTELVGQLGNWSADKGDYYTSAETDTEIENANTSMKDYVDGTFITQANEGNLNVNHSTTSGTATTWDGETSQADLNANSSGFWDALNSPSDINTGDLTDDGTFRLESWDNFTGIPTATPSSGDTIHLSTAKGIFDYIAGLNYVANAITSLLSDTTPQLGGYLDTNGQNIGATDDEIENIYVGDNTRIYFGDGQDASIYFNGTVLIIG